MSNVDMFSVMCLQLTSTVRGRWVASLREMGDEVGSAPACCGSTLGSNPQTSLKNTKWAT
jgi:hypothetical protein